MLSFYNHGGILACTSHLPSLHFSPSPPWRHVNQTDYQKIQYDPIAVAIEAKRKTSGGDRAAQLGLWTAAWHV